MLVMTGRAYTANAELLVSAEGVPCLEAQSESRSASMCGGADGGGKEEV